MNKKSSIELISLLKSKLWQINLDMLSSLFLFFNRTSYFSMRMLTVADIRFCNLKVGRDILRFRIKEMLMSMAMATKIRESRRRRRGSEAGLIIKAAIMTVEEMHR